MFQAWAGITCLLGAAVSLDTYTAPGSYQAHNATYLRNFEIE